MDLQEFVTQTLLQITKGVQQAQEPARQLGGHVNATTTSAQKGDSILGQMANGQHVSLVSFDVALSVSESGSAGGGARLAVASFFSTGVEGTTKNAQESTSRVSFKVPLALPIETESANAAADKQKKDDASVHRFRTSSPPAV